MNIAQLTFSLHTSAPFLQRGRFQVPVAEIRPVAVEKLFGIGKNEDQRVYRENNNGWQGVIRKYPHARWDAEHSRIYL